MAMMVKGREKSTAITHAPRTRAASPSCNAEPDHTKQWCYTSVDESRCCRMAW